MHCVPHPYRIHMRKGRAPVRRPLSASQERRVTSFAIACCCCRVYRWTSSPFRRAQPRRPRWSCEGVIPPLSFATADSFNFQHDAGRHSLVLQNCSGWSSGQDGGRLRERGGGDQQGTCCKHRPRARNRVVHEGGATLWMRTATIQAFKSPARQPARLSI